jgi:hypothetical protein
MAIVPFGANLHQQIQSFTCNLLLAQAGGRVFGGVG